MSVQVTKYTHSCVRLSSEAGVVLVDPGGFSGAAELEQALAGVDAVLVDTLLLAVHAPWSSVGAVLDHLIAVRAGNVRAIHDGLLNDRGRAIVDGHLGRVADEYGCTYAPLAVGETASD